MEKSLLDLWPVVHDVQVHQHMIRHRFPTTFCGSAFTQELDLLPGG